MALRKYHLCVVWGQWAIPITICMMALAPTQLLGFSFTVGNKNEVNCSHLCVCEVREIDILMRQNRHLHVGLMGTKYRPELQYGHKSEYMAFLGVFGAMVRYMMEVSCQISDGQSHKLSSLLNNVEKMMHTSLEVKCQAHEELIWDVPTWEVDFNVFVSDNCRLAPMDPDRGLVVPMNMWIFDVHRGGTDLPNMLDIKFLMNTVAFLISESPSPSIPKNWLTGVLISASIISLQYNGLETFDCRMLFKKTIDTLNLDRNEFVRFPDCLLKSSQTKLKYLSLARNLISDLTPLYDDSSSFELPEIHTINLSFNDIRSLEELKAMPSLKVLDLSHNFIREIPDNVFSKQTQLTHLYLGHNRIVNLGYIVFQKNINFVKLDLSSNYLSTIFVDQLPTTSMSMSVDIRNNKLTVPPFQECVHHKFPLTKASFISAGNPFLCDCRTMEFERCLSRVQAAGINSTVPPNMYEDLDNLACQGPSEIAGVAIKDLHFSKECIIEDDCPSSCECTLRNSQDLDVNCSSRSLLEMPDSIPSFRNATLVLRLDHNPMQMLSYRAYLHYLSELHMDNCLISSVTPTAIAALQNVHILTLHNNLLQKLPASTRNITMNQARNVTLHNNRWHCSCDSLWLPRWISKHRAILWAPGTILCNYLRKPVEDFSNLDVNCNSSSSYLEVVLAVCMAFASLITTLGMVIYYRTEINLLAYSKLGIRLGSTLVYGDSFSPYDAFVSYSQENYKWVVDTLVPQLENGPFRYKLCLHYRDFPSGEPVVDNIPWAIHLSRCSILVLSNDFVKKEWNIMELRAAFQRLLLVANKLIVIVTDDICMDELSPDLKAYLNTHEFLRVSENNFWEKLNMFLPPKTPEDQRAPALRLPPDHAGGDTIEGEFSESEFPDDQSQTIAKEPSEHNDINREIPAYKRTNKCLSTKNGMGATMWKST